YNTTALFACMFCLRFTKEEENVKGGDENPAACDMPCSPQQQRMILWRFVSVASEAKFVIETESARKTAEKYIVFLSRAS
ncbi:hypothetical protein THAOC_08218, partial [Thalassiosira oceanica]